MAETAKRRGRPPGPVTPPEKQRKPRTMRLTDAQWAELQRLGAVWLEAKLEDARAARVKMESDGEMP